MTGLLHPRIEAWFTARFGAPTEPQARGWPEIARGRDTLIAAPTGSGKTLAAFLMAIDGLFRQGLEGKLGEATQIVYVSPLKALANDVHKNLEEPLAEIQTAAITAGKMAPPIRVGTRTGDTLAGARAAMLRRPPHILVTTPESLYILLTSAGGRKLLKTTRLVIVDEIHALAGNKRGAHLALSLERLEHLAGPVQRVGLSATAEPLGEIAAFLGGARPRPEIVAVGDRRCLDLAVEAPGSELGPIATNEQWEERYQRLSELAGEHRSTLVFVSTRKLAERVAHRMRERLGEEAVAAHHGSLSRALRLRVEERFKAGELKMMVATASLELGLDIGTVDLVCQLGSTRQLASALQRVGRAGHWRGAIPKGRFFALTRDDLIECAALVWGLRQRSLDAIRIPEWPRDILAQQIAAEVAGEASPEGWEENALFELMRRAWPYRELPRAEYDGLIEVLSEGISGRRGRRGALLHRDGVHHRLRPRRGARLAAITGGGAIAETAAYAVVTEPENLVIGSLDEDFAIESNAGDIVLLGTHSWKVRGIETGRVRVEDAHGAPPTVPFWRGEAPGRTLELSQLVSDLRQKIAGLADLHAWLARAAECGLDERGARQAWTYIRESQQALGGVPSTRHLFAERFFDEGGGMQVVIHAPFGSAINRAWGMALRKRFCRSFDFELQAAAGENGLTLALSEQHSFPLETLFSYLTPDGVGAILEQAVLQSPLFQTRWRWTVGRALALARFSGGRKLPPQLQRMRAEDLLAAAFPMQLGCQDNHGGEDLEIPTHPYVQETMRDCLQESLDLEGLRRVLRGIGDGTIGIAALDTPAPSGLAQEILNVGAFGFLDDAPLEERRSRTVELRGAASAGAETGPGRLDPEAVEAVRAEAWPEPRTPDELHDLLLSLLWLPAAEVRAEWAENLEALRARGRVVKFGRGWVAAERVALLRGEPAGEPAGAVWPGVEFAGARLTADEAITARIVGGWLEILGPVTSSELAQRLEMEPEAVEAALLALEGQGRVLRGGFGWCERGLLARIHRRMVRRLRAEIEPVSAAVFYRFLRRWQHVEAGTRLHGLSGLQAVLEQMEGFEAPASAWERELLPPRVADYAPEMLDQLCLSGEFAWARLRPGKRSGNGRRAAPTRNSPIAFFRRTEAAWLLEERDAGESNAGLSPAAAHILAVLERRGASFFGDFNGQVPGHGLVKSQIEDGLWELVAAGRVTADGFDNLRAFLDPKRRSGQGRGAVARPRHAPGRWALTAAMAPPLEREDEASIGASEARRAEQAERRARMWLRRYGVVFQALLARENISGWYETLLACRRLEARGEIRGGRFVSGFSGEQYALPQAVEGLRALRRLGGTSVAVEVAAADPLNLVGILVPGEKIAATRTERVAVG